MQTITQTIDNAGRNILTAAEALLPIYAQRAGIDDVRFLNLSEDGTELMFGFNNGEGIMFFCENGTIYIDDYMEICDEAALSRSARKWVALHFKEETSTEYSEFVKVCKNVLNVMRDISALSQNSSSVSDNDNPQTTNTIEIDINSDAQMYDLGAVRHGIENLVNSIKDYNSVKSNRASFDKFKADGTADVRYREALGKLENLMENRKDEVNIALHSLGMKSISLKYSTIKTEQI